MSLISGMKNRDTRSQKSAVSGVAPSVKSVKNETYAEKKAKALAAKNTTVMTYEELERIKGMCSQTNEQEDYKTMRQNERQDKRMLSQARVSKWPNTIQAERERKEYERIKKLEDDEVSTFTSHLLWVVLFWAVSYQLYFCRSREEESTLKRRPSNKQVDRSNWTRPTRCSMTTRIWSKLCTARCFCAMSWLSNRFKSRPRREKRTF